MDLVEEAIVRGNRREIEEAVVAFSSSKEQTPPEFVYNASFRTISTTRESTRKHVSCNLCVVIDIALRHMCVTTLSIAFERHRIVNKSGWCKFFYDKGSSVILAHFINSSFSPFATQSKRKFECVKFLIEHGADPIERAMFMPVPMWLFKCNRPHSILHIASECGVDDRTLNILIDASSDISNVMIEEGDSLVYSSIVRQRFSSAMRLILLGAVTHHSILYDIVDVLTRDDFGEMVNETTLYLIDMLLYAGVNPCVAFNDVNWSTNLKYPFVCKFRNRPRSKSLVLRDHIQSFKQRVTLRKMSYFTLVTKSYGMIP